MTEKQIIATLETLKELGIPDTPIGVLRARWQHLLTGDEYHDIMEWAHEKQGLPRNWFRALVWSAN